MTGQDLRFYEKEQTREIDSSIDSSICRDGLSLRVRSLNEIRLSNKVDGDEALELDGNPHARLFGCGARRRNGRNPLFLAGIAGPTGGLRECP